MLQVLIMDFYAMENEAWGTKAKIDHEDKSFCCHWGLKAMFLHMERETMIKASHCTTIHNRTYTTRFNQ